MFIYSIHPGGPDRIREDRTRIDQQRPGRLDTPGRLISRTRGHIRRIDGAGQEDRNGSDWTRQARTMETGPGRIRADGDIYYCFVLLYAPL